MASSSPPSGLSKLGEYLVIKNLGEGTFGKVKLAIHTLSGQKVALKHINKGSINAYKVRMRVKREIEYLKLLQHPHIIKLYEVIDTPREVIMVMEYAGGELFNYIVDNGRLTESAARKFFQQIAYCLAYSHAHRIVHRDIKPENVLLDENLNVKLADFGLANEARDGDWLSTSCGSPNYAAPEVISGQLYAGPEIDVWSLGVILYVMVCGRLPFEDEHVPTLFQKISSGHFHKPSYLSPDVAHLIDKMLQTNPLKRLTIPEVLAHSWVSRDTPTYLREICAQQPLAPSTIDSLSSLVLETKDPSTSISSSSSSNDDDGHPEFYPGIGKLDPKVFNDLQAALGVDPSIVSSALAAFEDNCVKVAYQLFADRKGDRSLESIKEQDDSVSPSRPIAMSSSRNRGPGDYGSPHSAEDETEDDDDDDDDEFDESINWNSAHDIRLLDTSIVEGGGGGGTGEGNAPLPLFLPADHHLASYANMRNASKGRGSPARSITPSSKPRSYHWRHNAHASSSSHPHSNSNSHSPAALPYPKQHRHHQHKASKWHFGIRSSSPPMEVMLELYRTLEALGLEWREKKGIWAATAAASSFSFSESEDLMGESVSSTAAVAGSAGPLPLPPAHRRSRSRSRSMDVSNASDSYDQQTRDDLDIYYIECRWRVRNVVLLLDLQLYQVDPMNYLVDFRDLGYYFAYTSDPDHPDRFEPADYPYVPRDRKEGDFQNPLIFLDCACHLIIELAGGSG